LESNGYYNSWINGMNVLDNASMYLILYSQVKDVKLLKWLTNNNNYDIIILHMILKRFFILCNYVFKKL
jgi:uncharacterized protein YprB with RNaseH-like and TPR domain